MKKEGTHKNKLRNTGNRIEEKVSFEDMITKLQNALSETSDSF